MGSLIVVPEGWDGVAAVLFDYYGDVDLDPFTIPETYVELDPGTYQLVRIDNG